MNDEKLWFLIKINEEFICSIIFYKQRNEDEWKRKPIDDG